MHNQSSQSTNKDLRIGDVIDVFLAYTYVVLPLRKLDGGLPGTLQRRMEMNIVLDFVVGLIPFLGDLADAVYRCNTRNVILIEKHFERLALENEEKLTGGDVGRSRSGRGRDGRSRDPSRDPSGGVVAEPRRPEPAAQVPATSGSRGGRGWFGGRSDAPVESEYDDVETDVTPAKPPRPSGNGKLQRDPSRRENREERNARRF